MIDSERPSMAGESRKRERLPELLRLVDRRRRRRAALRIAAAALLIAAGFALAGYERQDCATSAPAESTALAPAVEVRAPLAPSYRFIDFAVIESEPALAERLVLPARAPSAGLYVDDEQALALLDEAGVRIGFARCGDEHYLVANTRR